MNNKIMKWTMMFGLVLFSQFSDAGEIKCSNQPKVKWSTYFSFTGKYRDISEITNVEFGLVEGSIDAGEAEDVDVIEFKSVKPNKALQATSSEWRDAIPYDLNYKGEQSTLYIQKESFPTHSGETKTGEIARLKSNFGGKKVDLKLNCRIN